MANKITKNVAQIDPASVSVKLSKKATNVALSHVQKKQSGGEWSAEGFGTHHDPERAEKQKNYAKADYIEPPENSLEDMLAGKPPTDPVKKPTMRNVGVTEPTKKYLKHFANDDVLKEGHNVSQKGMLSYKGEGRGNS